MPRTRVRKQNTVKSKQEEEANNNLLGIKKRIAALCKEEIDYIQRLRKLMCEQIEQKCISEKMQISKKYQNKSISEMGDILSLSSLYSSCMSNEDVGNATRTVRVNKKRITRSASFTGDDEGYLTTESTNSGPRASRSKTKKLTVQKKTRLSRSLTNVSKAEQQKQSKQTTPLNKGTPPNSYGLITPKVKPNTPLVLLRRPKMGEVALSMQGSPLMTAPIVTDHIANINIPLVDGTLLSLQAQRGLRKSHVPELDPDVKRQLEMLRENLNLII